VHLPHAMSYPISGNMKSWQPPGFQVDHPFVPHGITVILPTPAVVRFMAPVCPERLLWAAEALGAGVSRARLTDAGKILADTVAGYVHRLPIPNGLGAIGYTTDDIPQLVEGTLPQERIIRICPRRPDTEDLARLFEESMAV
ncbi:MAG: iron-containing alcohol dehydrogenase, partial [bacterium]|nr:iron-containing alcohol dehydrogenase [bacterium]